MFIQSSSPVDTEKDLRSTAANDNKSAIDLEKDFGHVVQALEQIETKLRIQYVPSLIERAPALEFDDIKENNSSSDNNQNDSKETPSPSSADGGVLATIDGTTASLRRRNLKHFSLSMFPTNPTITLDQLTILDVSHNELMELPGLSSLTNLLVLNLERNWFNTLPTEIGCCTKLQQLLAGRNFLRPNTNSLLFPQLQKLKCLKVLDLVYNQKCGRPHHRDVIRQALQLPDGLPSGIEINLTLWEEVGNVPGTYIGKSKLFEALELQAYFSDWILNPHYFLVEFRLYQVNVQPSGTPPICAANWNRGVRFNCVSGSSKILDMPPPILPSSIVPKSCLNCYERINKRDSW